MNTLIILILVAFILGVWRHLNQRYASVKFRVRLSNLRHELDRMIASGKIEENKSTIFFRELISKSISSHYFITLYAIIFAASKHPDPSIENVRLNQELIKNNNLNLLHRRMNCIVFMYIREQHYGSYLLIVSPLMWLGISAINIKNSIDIFLNSLSILDNKKIVISQA